MRIVRAAAALGLVALAGCGGHSKSADATSSTVGRSSASTSGVDKTRTSRRGAG
ncbi:hypothetical protein [Mycobacterium persicum]|uniref:hypothetical protein n=1 Tax=Mycobacterium persicum TaxID=1487726 RepID=UPI0013C37218|nr:hypothetical protein [Mycobacterium persicum]